MRSTKLFLNGLLILSIVLIVSCSQDEEKGPPTVSGISPAVGSYDMEVIIKGENFSTDKSKNVVRFNGLQAEVIEAKSNELTVLVPRGGSSGPVTVTQGELAFIGPDFRYFDIYLSGVEDDSNPRLWKNGIQQDFTGSPKGSTTALTRSAPDTYVTGFKFVDTEFFPLGYWLNDEFIEIGDSEDISDVTETVVSGADVYVAGAARTGPSKTAARYWKNGVMQTPESDDYAIGLALAIEVSGTDVYLGGVVQDIDGVYTAYWKNGELETLGDGLIIYDLKVVGTDVYMVGSGQDLAGNPLPMKYWKNGVSQVVANGARMNRASSMFIDGTDIYIAGSEMFATTSISGARVWKNNIGTYLFESDVESHAVGITVVEGHVFTAGTFLDDDGIYQAYYSIDGKVVQVTNDTQSVAISGIVVE